SFVDAPFFHSLSKRKLDEFGLDSSVQKISGTYRIPAHAGGASILSLSGDAFALTPSTSAFVAPGVLYNTNTIEQFNSFNKSEWINSLGSDLLSAIKSGEVTANPSLLASFAVLSFADLKRYSFHYWFAFPAIHTKWDVVTPASFIERDPQLTAAIYQYLSSSDLENRAFFAYNSARQIISLSRLTELTKTDRNWWNTWTVAFCDPNLSSEPIPGYLARNLLAWCQVTLGEFQHLSLLCFRDLPDSKTSSSVLITLKPSGPFPQKLTVSGWERVNGSLTPKVAHLASLMDPRQVAEQSVDLNLKLMRWRLVPDLDLEAIGSNKCLLLGAGTLGSYISRGLMAWGVRHITFVDSSTVSMSNPVRQPLYTFQDSVDQAPKALKAAEALKTIFPGVISTGHKLSIPMIGHPPSSFNIESIQNDYEKLVDLISSHDCIFLLTDSRESRWLPTVIGAALGKTVFTTALGFDSYVALRHGGKVDTPGRLGCYFCNDVYAPIDSTTDRTLDQMCTVTRPGAAISASSHTVELFAALMQHPLKVDAPSDGSTSTLGNCPHQIRGYLHNFSTLTVHGPAYDACSACSPSVVSEWKASGWDFIMKALEDPGYVEDLCGLRKLRQDAEQYSDS
ncbi:hypothetical protein CANCADRAFT_14939, partial [Tortispora caseinolytica NRRL Y-17796]